MSPQCPQIQMSMSHRTVPRLIVSITLFAFDKGEEISTHESHGDALVYILDGSASITIGGKAYALEAGQSVVMPAGIPHAVEAAAQFKMLLVVVFSL
ncbi:DNA-binding transcriptional repressor PuuR [Methylomusa anaerophila]|uniref:DNA-binding transcriptional repressor PuuR n=2 Tax=Methylomusa anaerophila TaxID=1930071 RepID=A0A348AK37_9FIRM|nr:DNA-binding transcriptional repressor PuuR [Methylomusa anaerophila]